ncbi:MAG: hypothetical protein ACREQI_10265 [Candidatus Binataceae bacterium]
MAALFIAPWIAGSAAWGQATPRNPAPYRISTISPPAAAGGAAFEKSAPASAGFGAVQDSAAAPVKKTLRQRVKALVARLTPARIKMDLQFRKAKAAFPAFCLRWQRDLRDRETNNLAHLVFNDKAGYQTATYTGYGKIDACTAHQSKNGYAIGRITYREFQYYLAGNTEEAARHAKPKPIGLTSTLEIFRWDKGKWFY